MYSYRSMKKLLIILLAGIYALSVFGMAPASMFCCDKDVLTELAAALPGDNSNGCCNSAEQEFTNTTQHIGAVTVHLSARSHTAQQPAGIFTKAVAVPAPGFAESGSVQSGMLPGKAIPLYRLHCVYRI